MKTTICLLTLLVTFLSATSGFASGVGVELSCNNGDLVVTHQYHSAYGHNYKIQMNNKGVINYFNQFIKFRNKNNVDLTSNALLTMPYGSLKSQNVFEAELEDFSSGEKTYVKVTKRDGDALVEVYLPNNSYVPEWRFESCQ